MTVSSFPFLSVSGDRSASAEDFASFIAAGFTAGPILSLLNGLNTAASSPNALSVDVLPGGGFNGAASVGWMRFVRSSTALTLAIPAADIANPRNDLVIMRTDLSVNERDTTIEIKRGNPLAVPVDPSLTQTATVWEHALARVVVAANAVSIADADITNLAAAQAGFITATEALALIAMFAQEGNAALVPDSKISSAIARTSQIPPIITLPNSISRTEAETGAAATLRLWSALRVKQAIVALGVSLPSGVSATEAQSGTSGTLRLWSANRVKQAVLSLLRVETGDGLTGNGQPSSPVSLESRSQRFDLGIQGENLGGTYADDDFLTVGASAGAPSTATYQYQPLLMRFGDLPSAQDDNIKLVQPSSGQDPIYVYRSGTSLAWAPHDIPVANSYLYVVKAV